MLQKINPQSENIILIGYQSGSYGHFLFYTLTHFFDKTVKIVDEDFTFDATGTSHLLKNYSKVWDYMDADNYPLDIKVPYTPDQKILILCDHFHRPTTDSYDVLKNVFPNATVLRVTTNGAAEPVMYHTYMTKCGYGEPISNQMNNHVSINWPTDEDWAIRENFTLWYSQGHPFHFSAKHEPGIVNLDLAKLITNTTQTLIDIGQQLGLKVIDYKKLSLFCKQWHRIQSKFFTILNVERQMFRALNNNRDGFSLTKITNLHDQGYLNYRIESEFNVSIPVYDYRDWFKHTDDIKAMLKVIGDNND